MTSSQMIRPTRMERKTAMLKVRFANHIQQARPSYDREYQLKEYDFYIEDSPCQLWSCTLSKEHLLAAPLEAVDDKAPNKQSQSQSICIWLLWDGEEVASYDDEAQAFMALISKQKSRRLDSKLRYYTSPLTVSAGLALLLMALVAYLEIKNGSVPDQLWSVFTAVVAFYFGRETSRSSRQLNLDDDG